MNNTAPRSILVFLFAFLFFNFSFAADKCIPEQPSPPQLVNNFSKELPDFLSADEQQQLEEKLENFSRETSNQIVIVIVDDLCGYDANGFSTRLGQQWKVGQGKFDNGVVIVVKPTGGAGQRDAYVAVGYGLEGVIPDITAKQILDNEITPYLKNGEYYNALNASTDVLISLAKKEYNYQDYQRIPGNPNWKPLSIFLIILVFYIFIAFRRRGRTISGSGRTYYGGGGWSSWGGGGSWGGGSSGGGGGFGGFGGGGFGGGGAGGKW